MQRFTALTLMVASLASAQVTGSGPDLHDVMQARNYGMAGAYAGLGLGTEAINGNPAAMSMYQRYQIDLAGSYDVGRGFGYAGVSLLDSQTNELAMGLSYHFVTYGADERRWAHVSTVAMAYPFTPAVHIGASIQHQLITGATQTNSVTVATGIMIRPVEWLMFGLSGNNLISVYNKDVPRYFLASVAARIADQLSPAVDVRLQFNGTQPLFSVSGGLEWLIEHTVPVRLGYSYDGLDGTARHFLGVGIGWFLEGSGIDIAYRHEFTSGGSRMLALTIKVQLDPPDKK